MLGLGGGEPDEKFEDPWSTPVGRADGLLIRAKCAPHFRRILWELNPSSPLLRNYAHGSCPAGKYYCRITPDGEVTPCPYMPVSAGNVRQVGFAELWEHGRVFTDLREPRLGGRCGACEFNRACGGCRARAFGMTGDVLAEDPLCTHVPGTFEAPAAPAIEYGASARATLAWDREARERMSQIPAFVRGMVVRRVEAHCRERGLSRVTLEVLGEIRARMPTPRLFGRQP
jgi:radical SAM protein with 4Fe4S-binding SPASM domain